MKNKSYYLKIFFVICLTFFSNIVLSDEFEFKASEIQSLDDGNLLIGSGGVEINDSLDIIITGERFEFNKLKSVLKVLEKVSLKDTLNKNLIKSDQIVLYKDLNIVISKKKTTIELGNDHIIESSNITFDRNLNIIFSNEKTLITDLNNNTFSMSGFSFSIKEKILSADDVKINDADGNIYNVKNIKYNMETNEVLGKDLSSSFNNKNLSVNENEPRLKGNAFFYNDNLTQINKGVFTTCKKNDSCPPWVLSSEKIEHDKIKKTINYKNAWLKIYDTPVFYFPKFFHPDPTVKRQSGFLMPNFSQSSNLGNYISTPYFVAISKATDLTFSPRLYDDGSAIYQAEYRNYKKKSEHIIDFSVNNKSALILDDKKNSSSTHFFLKSKFDLDVTNFDEAKLDLKIQQTSDDDYLKTYKLKSPLIESENTLHSSIDLNINRQDLEIAIVAEAYENLSLSNNDRYEYVYPSFTILKNIKDFDNGNLSLNSSGHNKEFDTNINEKTFINDLNYKSYNKINALGLTNNYEILLKNYNNKSQKSTTNKNKTENSLQSIINYEMKYPLQKIGEKFLSTITPTLSARYSPNKTKDKSQDDRIIDLNNIFSINRIGYSDTVEGGQSVTIGSEYALYNNKGNNKKLLTVNLATALRDVENNRLPTNSTLGKKNSDIFGNIDFDASKFVDFTYNFSLDNNLKTLNFNQIKSNLTFNNFVSTFDFFEKNNLLGSESYFSNESKLKINKSSSLGFKTRINKEKDLTEYYNLIYEYRNDCLIAGIEFKKDFYSDGSLKPEERLFFSITIMPFGKFNTPSINQ